MVPGRGTFEDVLERVRHERADDPLPGSSYWTRIRGLNASFVGTQSEVEYGQDSGQLHAAYYDDISVAAAPPPPDAAEPEPARPARAKTAPAKPEPAKPEPTIDVSMFKRLSREDIARDINLLPSDTRAELQRKRRNFARINHPDRAPKEWRDAATTRMMLANHLVDDALRKISLQRC